MWTILRSVLGTATSLYLTRRELALENLALRQQVAVLIRTGPLDAPSALTTEEP